MSQSSPMRVALVIDFVWCAPVWSPLDDAGLALLALEAQGELE